MAKKVKRTGMILGLLLCLIAGVIIGIHLKKENELRKATYAYTYSVEPNFDWFYAYYEGKNDSLAILTQNDINSPTNWWMGEGCFADGAVESTRVLVHNEIDHVDLYKCEIQVYDIFEQKVVKTIDCIPILEEYVPGYYFLNYNFVASGKSLYLVAYVSDFAEERDWKDVCINLDTEEVKVLPDYHVLAGAEAENSEADKVWREEFFGEDGSIHDLLRENGYTFTLMTTDGDLDAGEYNTIQTYEEGTFIIRVALSSLSMENELLNEYFPELKNYEGAEDDMVTFILKGYPSKEEVAEMLK